MTAEIKTFPDPQELAAYVNDLYTAGSTSVVVTRINASVYLLQYD